MFSPGGASPCATDATLCSQNRADATSRRKKNNREAESLTGGQEAKGSSYWEQIIEYIDFSMDTNKGEDPLRLTSVDLQICRVLCLFHVVAPIASP